MVRIVQDPADSRRKRKRRVKSSSTSSSSDTSSSETSQSDTSSSETTSTSSTGDSSTTSSSDSSASSDSLSPVRDASTRASSSRAPQHHPPPKILCPCARCKGRVWQTQETSFAHVGNHGRYDPEHYEMTTSGRIDIVFGGAARHEIARTRIVEQALMHSIPREAWGRMRACLARRDGSRPLGFDFSTRPRSDVSIPRRRRMGRIPTPFLEDHHFARELHGRALEIVRDCHPEAYRFPRVIPIDTRITIWGREWIVRRSTLVRGIGLGLFACTSIVVSRDCAPADRPALFPFCGPKYSARDWMTLSRQCSTYGRYGIRLDLHPVYSFVDGYPPRTSNLAGYINSSRGLGARGRGNAEWVECRGAHPEMDPRVTHYVMTCATRTIQAGDEILVDYDYRRTWVYHSG